MKYLKGYRLFEDSTTTTTEEAQESNTVDISGMNLYEIIKGIMSGSLDEEAISKVKCLDDPKFCKFVDCGKDFVVFDVNMGQLSHKMDIEDYVIGMIDNMNSDYGNYEYAVDSYEHNYLSNHITDESIEKLIKFIEYLGGEINRDSDDVSSEINEYLTGVGLDKFLFGEMDAQISLNAEEAIKKKIRKEITSVSPITVEQWYNHNSNSNKENQYLSFDYKMAIGFMEDNNLTATVKDFGDLLENIGGIICYDYSEIDSGHYEYLDSDAKDSTDKAFMEQLDEVYDCDGWFPYNELFKLLIEGDNVDIIKDKFGDIEWAEKVKENWWSSSEEYYLPHYAKEGSMCQKWLASNEFLGKFDPQTTDEEFYEYIDAYNAYHGMKELGIL